MEDSTLQSRRQEAADGEWRRYDMGGYLAEDADGWEWTTRSLEMTRVVYFENAEDPGSATVKGQFTVRFRDFGSAEVDDVSASIGGCLIGRRVPPEPTGTPGRPV